MKVLRVSKNVYHVFDNDGWKHAYKAVRSVNNTWAIHPYNKRCKVTADVRNAVFKLNNGDI